MNCTAYRILLSAATYIIVGSATAQQCENLISLSKTVTSTVADKSAFEQHASNFCSDYKKSGGSSSSTNVGASYKFLSASFGQSNMSKDEVASKVCSANSAQNFSSDAFKQYVETIATGAYPAYETCLRLNSTNDLRFDVDLGSVLPAEFTVVIGYSQAAQGADTSDLVYSASEGVSCTWNGKQTSKMALKAPSSVPIKCNRSDQSKPGYVRIIRTNGVGASLTLPWPAYDKNGIPIATLAKIRSDVKSLDDRLENLQGENAALSSALRTEQQTRIITIVPSSIGCPSGWQDIGIVGWLINNAAIQYSLGGGGVYNSGWTWQHPRACKRI